MIQVRWSAIVCVLIAGIATSCSKSSPVQSNPPSVSAPALIFPVEGAVFTSTPRTTSFSWGTVDGAATYNIWIDKSVSGVWVSHVAQRGLPANNYSMPALAADGFARWRVSATNANAIDSPLSEWRGFSFNTTLVSADQRP